jgi:hypothetical protein
MITHIARTAATSAATSKLAGNSRTSDIACSQQLTQRSAVNTSQVQVPAALHQPARKSSQLRGNLRKKKSTPAATCSVICSTVAATCNHISCQQQPICCCCHTGKHPADCLQPLDALHSIKTNQTQVPHRTTKCTAPQRLHLTLPCHHNKVTKHFQSSMLVVQPIVAFTNAASTRNQSA